MWPDTTYLYRDYKLGGGFKYFWNFHPKNWGNDPIWRAYFSDGWLNHQLVKSHCKDPAPMSQSTYDSWFMSPPRLPIPFDAEISKKKNHWCGSSTKHVQMEMSFKCGWLLFLHLASIYFLWAEWKSATEKSQYWGNNLCCMTHWYQGYHWDDFFTIKSHSLGDITFLFQPSSGFVANLQLIGRGGTIGWGIGRPAMNNRILKGPGWWFP